MTPRPRSTEDAQPQSGLMRAEHETPTGAGRWPVSRPQGGPNSLTGKDPGDTLTVSGLFRLCRDLVDIHHVRAWCQARGVALRVLSGPLSTFHDLAAGDATTALLINVITAVGQFQRDVQNELTAEGIAAAEAQGRYRGRPPALTGPQREAVRSTYTEQGASIAALARTHGVSRTAIRTALADLLPDPSIATSPSP
ncbi:recombinase family protein [Spirillospora sp. NPDC127200]